jgi:hypothetical protein
MVVLLSATVVVATCWSDNYDHSKARCNFLLSHLDLLPWMTREILMAHELDHCRQISGPHHGAASYLNRCSSAAAAVTHPWLYCQSEISDNFTKAVLAYETRFSRPESCVILLHQLLPLIAVDLNTESERLTATESPLPFTSPKSPTIDDLEALWESEKPGIYVKINCDHGDSIRRWWYNCDVDNTTK